MEKNQEDIQQKLIDGTIKLPSLDNVTKKDDEVPQDDEELKKVDSIVLPDAQAESDAQDQQALMQEMINKQRDE